jgi:hypothetical protein
MSGYEVSEAQYDEVFGPAPTAASLTPGEVSEAEYDAAFDRKAPGPGKFERDVADFKRVGLLPDIAEKAARALQAGTYGTFEEAALMCSPLTQAHGSRLGRVDAGVLSTVVKERA